MPSLNTQKGHAESEGATSHPTPLPVEAQQPRGYFRGLIGRLLKSNGTAEKAQPMSPEAIRAWDNDKAALRAKEGAFLDWI